MTIPGDPAWPHVPGEGRVADRETLERAKALVPRLYDGFVPADDPALRYGLSLNDRGLFWEAHEILEAVWKVAPQGGRDRILLRACIQVANANLKMKMAQPRAVRRLLLEALAELNEVVVRAGSGISNGFADSYPVEHLRRAIGERLDQEDADTGPVSLTET